MAKDQPAKYEQTPQHLEAGRTVKNLERKLPQVGRPSIFVGSSTESLEVARKVKAHFPSDLFEVDIWDEGIFGQTTTFGGEATNAEQLKNFTDIYDFAIFIFVPDDKIVSQTRKDISGKNKQAFATRHNVVFEFGLFLGRIGAKRSFILFDDDVRYFVDHFFTDLKENLSDTQNAEPSDKDPKNKFRIELYSYKGYYQNHLEEGGVASAFDEKDFASQVSQIKFRVLETFKTVDIGFLPSTSLAIGYYNNFLKIVVENINKIVSGELTESDLDDPSPKIVETMQVLSNAKRIIFNIVLPDSIEAANHNIIKPYLESELLITRGIPGTSRTMPVKVTKSSYDQVGDFVIFDVPTTMYSSVEAVDMLNPHSDIRELLSEKEKRNFKKAVEHKIAEGEKHTPTQNIRKIISMITWEEFLKETNQINKAIG